MNTKELETKLKELARSTNGFLVKKPVGTIQTKNGSINYEVGVIEGTSPESILTKSKRLTNNGRRRFVFHEGFGVSPRLKGGRYTIRATVV